MFFVLMAIIVMSCESRSGKLTREKKSVSQEKSIIVPATAVAVIDGMYKFETIDTLYNQHRVPIKIRHYSVLASPEHLMSSGEYLKFSRYSMFHLRDTNIEYKVKDSSQRNLILARP